MAGVAKTSSEAHARDRDREHDVDGPEPEHEVWPGKVSRSEELRPVRDDRVGDLAKLRGALTSLDGGGRDLPHGVSSKFSRLLGADLAAVRVHDGGSASEHARSMGARAFTHGSHIVFAPGAYRPGSAATDHVLAHEVIHVVQNQRSGGKAMHLAARLDIGPSGSSVESEAEDGARAITAGRTFSVGARGSLPGISLFGGNEPVPSAPNSTPATQPAEPNASVPGPNASTAPPAGPDASTPGAAPQPGATAPGGPTAPTPDGNAPAPAGPTPAPSGPAPNAKDAGTGGAGGAGPGPTAPAGAGGAPGVDPSAPAGGKTTPTQAGAAIDARIAQILEQRADPAAKASYAKGLGQVQALRLQALQYTFQKSGIGNTLFQTLVFPTEAVADHWGQIYKTNAYRGGNGNGFVDGLQATIEGIRGGCHILGDLAAIVSAWAGMVAIVAALIALIGAETGVLAVVGGIVAAIADSVSVMAGLIKILLDCLDAVLGVIQMIILIIRARCSKDPGERARFAQLLHKEAGDLAANVVGVTLQVAVLAATAGVGVGMTKGISKILTKEAGHAFVEELGKLLNPRIVFKGGISGIAEKFAVKQVGKGVKAPLGGKSVAIAGEDVLKLSVLKRVAGRVTKEREIIPFTVKNQMNGAKLVRCNAALKKIAAMDFAAVPVGGLTASTLIVQTKAPSSGSLTTPGGTGGIKVPEKPAGALNTVAVWPSQIEAFQNAKGPLAGAMSRTEEQYENAKTQAGPELAAQVDAKLKEVSERSKKQSEAGSGVAADAQAGKANSDQGAAVAGKGKDEKAKADANKGKMDTETGKVQTAGSGLKPPPPKDGILSTIYNATIGRIGNWIGTAQTWIKNFVGKAVMWAAGFSKEDLDLAGIEDEMRTDSTRDTQSEKDAKDAQAQNDPVQKAVFELMADKSSDQQAAIQGMAEAKGLIEALEEADKQLDEAIKGGQAYIEEVTPILQHELETQTEGKSIDAAYVAPIVGYADAFTQSIENDTTGSTAQASANGSLAEMKATFEGLDTSAGQARISSIVAAYNTARASEVAQAKAGAAQIKTSVNGFVGTTDYQGINANAEALDHLASDFDAADAKLADELYKELNAVLKTYIDAITKAIADADAAAPDNAPAPPGPVAPGGSTAPNASMPAPNATPASPGAAPVGGMHKLSGKHGRLKGAPGDAAPAPAAPASTPAAAPASGPLSIKSTTTAKAAAAGSDRFTVGVGEEVEFTSSTGESGQWTIAGGTPATATGASFKWNAPDTAGQFKVELKVGTTVATKSMAVIVPTGVKFERRDTYGPSHAEHLGAGLTLNMWVLPFNVSFTKISLLEKPGGASATSGYFASVKADISHHPETDPTLVRFDNSTDRFDDAHLMDDSVDPWPKPLRIGQMTWQIPYLYSVGAVKDQPFTIVTQTMGIVDPKGTVTVSKGGVSYSRTPTPPLALYSTKDQEIGGGAKKGSHVRGAHLRGSHTGGSAVQPGRASLTSQLNQPRPITSDVPGRSMRTDALQMYGGGDPAPAPAASGGSASGTPAAAARVTSASFEVSSFTARHNTRLDWGRTDGRTGYFTVQSGGIRAEADVRATTPEAQRYQLGFVQTMHGSERRARYQLPEHPVDNEFVVTRGTCMDQRTDLQGADAPWYNPPLHGRASQQHPAMTDNPTFVVPMMSPGNAPLHDMAGHESFTTYLVAMVGQDSSTIVYLGNVHWNVNWQGRFTPGLASFSGHDARIGGTSISSHGGATLGGSPANAGSGGAFTGGAGAAHPAAAHGAPQAFGMESANQYGPGGPPPPPQADQGKQGKDKGKDGKAALNASKFGGGQGNQTPPVSPPVKGSVAPVVAGKKPGAAAVAPAGGEVAKKNKGTGGHKASAAPQVPIKQQPAVALQPRGAEPAKITDVPDVAPPQPAVVATPTGKIDPTHESLRSAVSSINALIKSSHDEILATSKQLQQRVAQEIDAYAATIEQKVAGGTARVGTAYDTVSKAIADAATHANQEITTREQSIPATIQATRAQKAAEITLLVDRTKKDARAKVTAGPEAAAAKASAVAFAGHVKEKHAKLAEKIKADTSPGGAVAGNLNPKSYSGAVQVGGKAAYTAGLDALGEDKKLSVIKKQADNLLKMFDGILKPKEDLYAKQSGVIITESLDAADKDLDKAVQQHVPEQQKHLDEAAAVATKSLQSQVDTQRTGIATTEKQATARLAHDRKAAEDGAHKAGKQLSEDVKHGSKEIQNKLGKKAAQDAGSYGKLTQQLQDLAKSKKLDEPTRIKLDALKAQLTAAHAENTKTLEELATTSITELKSGKEKQFEEAIQTYEAAAAKTKTELVGAITTSTTDLGKSFDTIGTSFDATVASEKSKLDIDLSYYVDQAPSVPGMYAETLEKQLTNVIDGLTKGAAAALEPFKLQERLNKEAEPEIKAAMKLGPESAQGLWDAMDGIGTDENKIYGILRKATPGEIVFIEGCYNDAYSKRGTEKYKSPLRADLDDELSGTEWDIAFAYLRHDRDKALRLELADSRGVFNDEEDRMEDVLRAASDDEIKNLVNSPEGKATLERVRGCLSSCDLDVVNALTKIDTETGLPAADRKVQADAIRIYDAMYGGITGIGTDEARIKEKLEACKTKEERQALHDAYNAYIRQKDPLKAAELLKDKDNAGVDLMDASFNDEMSGGEWTYVRTLSETKLDDDKHNATVKMAKLVDAAQGAGTDEDKSYEALEDEEYAKKYADAPSDAARQKLAADREIELNARLKDITDAGMMTKGFKNDSVTDIIKGEMGSEDVTFEELKHGHWSTDEKKRPGKAGASLDRKTFQLRAQMGNLNLEQMVAQRILQAGKAEPELLIAYACWGVTGTDEATLKKALKKGGEPMDKGDLATLKSNFLTYWGVELSSTNEIYLMDFKEPTGTVPSEVSGKDWLEIRILLMGKPTTPKEIGYVDNVRYRFVTSGTGSPSPWSHAREDMEVNHQNVQTMVAEHKDETDLTSQDPAKRTEAEVKALRPDGKPLTTDDKIATSAYLADNRFEQLASYAEKSEMAFLEAKEAVANAVITIIELVGAALITAVSMGASSPMLVLFIGNLILSGMTILIRKDMVGDAYGSEEIGIDVVKGIVMAALAAASEAKFVTNFAGKAGKLAGKTWDIFAGGVEKAGMKVVENEGLAVAEKAAAKLTGEVATATKQVASKEGQKVAVTAGEQEAENVAKQVGTKEATNTGEQAGKKGLTNTAEKEGEQAAKEGLKKEAANVAEKAGATKGAEEVAKKSGKETFEDLVKAGTKNATTTGMNETADFFMDEKTYDMKFWEALFGETGLGARLLKKIPSAFAQGAMSDYIQGLAGAKGPEYLPHTRSGSEAVFRAMLAEIGGNTAGFLTYIDNYSDASTFWLELLKSNTRSIASGGFNGAFGHAMRAQALAREFANGHKAGDTSEAMHKLHEASSYMKPDEMQDLAKHVARMDPSAVDALPPEFKKYVTKQTEPGGDTKTPPADTKQPPAGQVKQPATGDDKKPAGNEETKKPPPEEKPADDAKTTADNDEKKRIADEKKRADDEKKKADDDKRIADEKKRVDDENKRVADEKKKADDDKKVATNDDKANEGKKSSAVKDEKPGEDHKDAQDDQSAGKPKAEEQIAPKVTAPDEKHAATQEQLDKGHAGVEVHSHFIGNVPDENIKAQVGKSAGPVQSQVSEWEPLLREISKLKNNDEIAHARGEDGKIKKRGAGGDAVEQAQKAVLEIAELKRDIKRAEKGEGKYKGLDEPARQEKILGLKEQIEAKARTTVEAALRATDETDFNSSYAIRDELIKKHYGGQDREAVLGTDSGHLTGDALMDEATVKRLRDHFAGRETVLARIQEAEGIQSRSKKGLSDDDKKKLAALKKSLEDQFAYDQYTKETISRLAEDNIKYTEQSNSGKKLDERFDKDQLAALKKQLIDEQKKIVATSPDPVAREAAQKKIQQLENLQIAHLAMVNTSFFGTRDKLGNEGEFQNFDRESEQGKKAWNKEMERVVNQAANRDDTAGVDIAGMEHFRFDQIGKDRMMELVGKLAAVATPEHPIVIRPHVGEGAVDTKAGESANINHDKYKAKNGKEDSHYDRGRSNVDSMLDVFEAIAAKNGGKLPPNLIVRFGHVTHASPDAVVRMAKLGIIAEVNLTSNIKTGAVNQNPDELPKPSPGEPKPNLPDRLEDHSLPSLIFAGAPVILSTDSHEVMGTDLPTEYKTAKDQIERVRNNEQAIRVTVEQAKARGWETTEGPPPHGVVRYYQLDTEEKRRFDEAYDKLYKDANKYYANRPNQDGGRKLDPGDDGSQTPKTPPPGTSVVPPTVDQGTASAAKTQSRVEEQTDHLRKLKQDLKSGDEATKRRANEELERLHTDPDWQAALKVNDLFDIGVKNNKKRGTEEERRADSEALSKTIPEVMADIERRKVGADPILQNKRENFEHAVAMEILNNGTIRKAVDAELARLCDKAYDYIKKTRTTEAEQAKALSDMHTETSKGYGGGLKTKELNDQIAAGDLSGSKALMLDILKNGNIRERMLALQEFANLIGKDALSADGQAKILAAGDTSGDTRKYSAADATKLVERARGFMETAELKDQKAVNLFKPTADEAAGLGPRDHSEYAGAKAQRDENGHEMDTKLPPMLDSKINEFLGKSLAATPGQMSQAGENNPLARTTITVREAVRKGLQLSDREIAALGGMDAPLNWVVGSKANIVNENIPFIQNAKQNSMPLKAGISGTTYRWMQIADMLGGDPKIARLAAIASLEAADAHTFHEIAVAAKGFGVDYNLAQPYAGMALDSVGLDTARLEALAKSVGTTMDELNGARPAP